MMLARGFHHAAGELEALQRRMIHKPSKRWVPLLLTLNKTSIGRRIYWLVSNGRHFGRHFLCDTPPIKPDQGLGRAAGAVVLEALAIELGFRLDCFAWELPITTSSPFVTDTITSSSMDTMGCRRPFGRRPNSGINPADARQCGPLSPRFYLAVPTRSANGATCTKSLSFRPAWERCSAPLTH